MNINKKVRFALFKAVKKNKKEYQHYLKKNLFDYIENVKDVTELGHVALRHNKAGFYCYNINLQLFDCKAIGKEMLKNGWLLIDGIAIQLIPTQKYTIEVIEVLTKQVEIKAEDKEIAIEKVEQMYKDSKIVLDSNDFSHFEIIDVDKQLPF